MGKYADGLKDMKKSTAPINVEIVKMRMLQAIANELAEMNRLTRCKMNENRDSDYCEVDEA